MKQCKLMKDVLRDLRKNERKKKMKKKKKKTDATRTLFTWILFLQTKSWSKRGRGHCVLYLFTTCGLPWWLSGDNTTSVRNASVCLLDACARAGSLSDGWVTGPLMPRQEDRCQTKEQGGVGLPVRPTRACPGTTQMPRSRTTSLPALPWEQSERRKERGSGEMLAIRKLTAWLALHNLGRTHCGKHD